MIAEDATSGGGGLPSSGDIRELSEQIGAVHAAVEKGRLRVRFLFGFFIAVALGLGVWSAFQQQALKDAAAKTARQDRQIAALEQHDAAVAKRAAQFARLNCQAGNRYKAGVRAAFEDLAPLVQYKSPADAAKAAHVLAGVRVTTAPRDCAALSLKLAR